MTADEEPNDGDRVAEWSLGGGRQGCMTCIPCSEQMWMSASRARACAAEGSVRTCLALSAVCARLASGARRVKRMWMSVPRSHRPAGQAVVTTRRAPFTVPALLASAPVGRGPPAKVRVLSPRLLQPHLPWGQERDMTGGAERQGDEALQEDGGSEGVGGPGSRVSIPFSKYECALHSASLFG